MACVYSVDGSGGGVSDREERFEDQTDLASEEGNAFFGDDTPSTETNCPFEPWCCIVPSPAVGQETSKRLLFLGFRVRFTHEAAPPGLNTGAPAQ